MVGRRRGFEALGCGDKTSLTYLHINVHQRSSLHFLGSAMLAVDMHTRCRLQQTLLMSKRPEPPKSLYACGVRARGLLGLPATKAGLQAGLQACRPAPYVECPGVVSLVIQSSRNLRTHKKLTISGISGFENSSASKLRALTVKVGNLETETN